MANLVPVREGPGEKLLTVARAFRTPVACCDKDQPPCRAREDLFLLVQEKVPKEGHPTAWPFGPSRPDGVRPRSLTTDGCLGAGSTRRRVALSLGATSLSLRPRPAAAREASRQGGRTFVYRRAAWKAFITPASKGKHAASARGLSKSKGEAPYALPRERGIAGSGRQGRRPEVRRDTTSRRTDPSALPRSRG